MKKILNIALLITLILTIMVPLTGVHVHKMASTFFLLLSIVHIITYRKKMGAKRWLLFAIIIISFATGLFGMILDYIPVVLILHRAVSIGLVFFLAIHIFVFHKSFADVFKFTRCIFNKRSQIGSGMDSNQLDEFQQVE